MNILTFSNYAPEHIVDLRRFQGYNGKLQVSNYCGYARDFISQVCEDPVIDGAIIPRSCDSARVAADYLDGCGKFVYTLSAPVLTGSAAIEYFSEIIKDMQQRLCEYFNVSITTVAILERCRALYERNSSLAQIYSEIDGFSYYGYLSGINKMLGNPLLNWETHVPVLRAQTAGGKKIYIIGSFITNLDIVKQIEECGFIVAGDNLTNSKRLFSSNTIIGSDDLYRDIARSILSGIPSPTQSLFDATLESDISEIKQKGIKGVIYFCQKYCEPYDFMFQAYKSALDALDIPLCRIFLTDSRDKPRLELLENFYETI